MGAGRRRIGLRLGAGLALLVALWTAAAVPAGGDAIRAVRLRAAADQLGRPTDAVVLALQEERRWSTGYPAGTGPDPALVAPRARTDRARDELRRAAAGAWQRSMTGPDAAGQADDLLRLLEQLPALRAAVDARQLDRFRVLTSYTEIIDTAFAAAPWLLPGQQNAAGTGLVAVSRAREALAQEDALLRGAFAAQRLDDRERARLAELAAGRRTLLADAGTRLPADARARSRRLPADPRYGSLRAIEDKLILDSAPGRPPVISAADWAAALDPVHADLRDLEVAAGREAVRAATPGAVVSIVCAGLVGGVGLVAVIAVLMMARRWAGRPDRTGSPDGPAAGAGGPADPAYGHAERRLSALLLDLHRRSQNLLHRQLRLLDGMERRESDDETLGDLFRADHLANRMRRNIEKALVLGGGAPGRRWRRPVPLVDVVRGAASEVTEYVRVSTAQIEPAGLAGTAVTDVMHLLAELVDNATTFAPSDTRVRVSGERQPDGYVLTVSDTGPGMTDDDLFTAHEVMSSPEPPGGGAWWGLYAVGRFADRHGITVRLRGAPGGGLIAEVSIPAALLTVEDDDGVPPSGTGPPTERVARLRGRVRDAGDDPDEASTTELPAVDPQWTTS